MIAKLLGADQARQTLLDQAPLQPGGRALDIGCGTGTFAVALKQRHPSVEIVGVDPDERALARAKRKAERARVEVRFQRGFADSLQYPAATFDVVFSSFMFHHLEGNNREKTLREVSRVLKPRGVFDFGTLIWPHFGRLIWPHLIYSDRSSYPVPASRDGEGDGQETQGGTV